MATPTQELLAELRAEQGDEPPVVQKSGQATATALLEQLRAEQGDIDLSQEIVLPPPLPVTQDRGISGLNEGLRMVNSGLANVFLSPVKAIDAARGAGTETAIRLMGEEGAQAVEPQIREFLGEVGVLPRVGNYPKGVFADALEFFGGSLPFTFGLAAKGYQLSKTVPEAALGMFERGLVKSSATPKAIGLSAISDLSGSFGAAIGGAAAEQFDLGPTGTVLLQMGGGFLHPLSLLGASSRGVSSVAGKVTEKVAKTRLPAIKDLNPFSRASATRRAATELQSGFVDPTAAASKIDISSPLPAARQTGVKGAIELEEAVLKTDPKLRQQYTDDLNNAIDQAIIEARNLGNPAATGDLLKRQSAYLRNVVTLRSAQAMQEAENAILALGQAADPIRSSRRISRIVKNKVEAAYKSLRKGESKVWRDVDLNDGADTKALREVVAKELVNRSLLPGVSDPTLIPPYVKNLLRAKGPLKARDLQDVRSQIGDAYDVARVAGQKNRARVLNDINKALLDDMDKVPGLEAAIAYSRDLNQKFTQGGVGRILAKESGGLSKIDAPDTLGTILTSKSPARTLRQMIAGTPETAVMFEDFMRSRYLADVLLEVGDDIPKLQRAHAGFIKKWSEKGIFNVFPDLKRQLNITRKTILRSAAKREQLKIIRQRGGARLSKENNISAANQYVDGRLGVDLTSLINNKTAIRDARRLLRKMGNDQSAKNGLKSAWVETLIRTADDGVGNTNYKQLAKLITNNQRITRALGYTTKDLARINKITKTVNATALKAAGTKKAIVEDAPASVLEFLARFTGVTIGSKAASLVPGGGPSAGPSLMLSAFFSKRMNNMLNRFHARGPEQIIKDAYFDNSLYQALLTAPTDSLARQDAASRVLHSWLLGVGIEEAQGTQ